MRQVRSDARWQRIVGYFAMMVAFCITPAVGDYSLLISPMDPIVSEGFGLLPLQVTVTGCVGPANDIVLPVQSIEISATQGLDFLPPSVSFVTLGESGLSQVFNVAIIQDNLIEGDETFEVLIETNPNAILVCNNGDQAPSAQFFHTLVTIADDDAPPLPVLSIGDAQVTEGDSGTVEALFTLSLSGPAPGSVIVEVMTNDGTATASDADYHPRSEFVQIPAGQLMGEFAVAVNGDTQIESDETFFVNLGAPDGANLGDGQAVGTIVNDDLAPPPPLPTLSIGNASVVEGDSGLTAMEFKVSLSEPVQFQVSVGAGTREGTALGHDFQPAMGTVVFDSGQTTASFVVQIIGDTSVEGDETLFVDLSNPDGALVEDGEGQGTIIDDDDTTPPPPGESELRIANASRLEGNSGNREVQFAVTLVPASPERVTVNYRTENGTAEAGSDYQTSSGVLGFEPGQTAQMVPVALFGDTLFEIDETFFVVLDGATGAVLADARGRGTIRNDDRRAPPAEITIQGDGEIETRPGSLVPVEVLVSREGEPAADVQVIWTVEGDASLEGGDRSNSGSDGVARNSIRLGNQPGLVTVTANLPDGASVSVSIRVLRSLVDLFGEQLADRSVALALDGLCDSPEGLSSLCRYLDGLNDDQARRAVSELTARESAGMGRVSLVGVHNQLDNVGQHLSGVRRSGDLGGSQVALGLGGHSWEPGDLWRAATGQNGSGQTPASPFALSLRPLEPLGEIQEESSDLSSSESRMAFFGSGQVSTGKRSETGLETGFDFDTYGLTAGLDYRAGPGLVVGAALGYLDTASEFSRDGGGLDVSGYSLTGFLTRYGERAYLDLVGSWGQNDYSLSRNIDLPVPFEGSSRFVAAGNPGGEQVALALSFGADWGGAASLGLFGGGELDRRIDRRIHGKWW